MPLKGLSLTVWDDDFLQTNYACCKQQSYLVLSHLLTLFEGNVDIPDSLALFVARGSMLVQKETFPP